MSTGGLWFTFVQLYCVFIIDTNSLCSIVIQVRIHSCSQRVLSNKCKVYCQKGTGAVNCIRIYNWPITSRVYKPPTAHMPLMTCFMCTLICFTDKCRGPEYYACAIDPYEESCRVRCIRKKRVCDGIVQCPFGDDEHNCGLGKDNYYSNIIQSCPFTISYTHNKQYEPCKIENSL